MIILLNSIMMCTSYILTELLTFQIRFLIRIISLVLLANIFEIIL